MTVTVQQVYNMAMALIDEVTETGNLAVENPDYYKTKSLAFLTTLQAELLPLSVVPVVLTDLSQELQLSDRECLTLLPYGLAAHLLLTDDPNAASFFSGRYEELKRKRQVTTQLITDVYGVLNDMGADY